MVSILVGRVGSEKFLLRGSFRVLAEFLFSLLSFFLLLSHRMSRISTNCYFRFLSQSLR